MQARNRASLLHLTTMSWETGPSQGLAAWGTGDPAEDHAVTAMTQSSLRYEGTATMMIEAACCLLDTADKGPGHPLKPSTLHLWQPQACPGGNLRSGWGTPVYHLAHLAFFDRLVSLGFAFHCFQGAPTSAVAAKMIAAGRYLSLLHGAML